MHPIKFVSSDYKRCHFIVPHLSASATSTPTPISTPTPTPKPLPTPTTSLTLTPTPTLTPTYTHSDNLMYLAPCAALCCFCCSDGSRGDECCSPMMCAELLCLGALCCIAAQKLLHLYGAERSSDSFCFVHVCVSVCVCVCVPH